MPPDYRSLQQWAKDNGVKANQRKVVLERAWNKAQGLGKQTSMFGAENLRTVSTREQMVARAAKESAIRNKGGLPAIDLTPARRGKFDPRTVGSVMGRSPLGQPSLANLAGAAAGPHAGKIYPGSQYSSAFRQGAQQAKFNPFMGGIGTSQAPSGLTVGGKPVASMAKNISKFGKFARVLGPAANALFIGMMLFDLIRRGGGYGAGTEQDSSSLALIQGGIVPQLQQQSAIGTDISRHQLGVSEMERLSNYARQKQSGMAEIDRGMSGDLDTLISMKKGRLARASFMSPDIQQHLANLVSTGTL